MLKTRLMEGLKEKDEKSLHLDLKRDDSRPNVHVFQFRDIQLSAPNEYPLIISKYVNQLTRQTLRLIIIQNDEIKQLFVFNYLSHPLYTKIYVLSFWLIFCLKSEKKENKIWITKIRAILHAAYQSFAFKISVDQVKNQKLKNELLDVVIHLIGYGIHKLFNTLFIMPAFTKPSFGEWVHFQLANELNRYSSSEQHIKLKLTEYFAHNFMSYLKESAGNTIESTSTQESGGKLTYRHLFKEINERKRRDYHFKLKKNLDEKYIKSRECSPLDDTPTQVFKQFGSPKTLKDLFTPKNMSSKTGDPRRGISRESNSSERSKMQTKLLLKSNRIGKVVDIIQRSSSKNSDPPFNTKKMLTELKGRSIRHFLLKKRKHKTYDVLDEEEVLTERLYYEQAEREFYERPNYMRKRISPKNHKGNKDKEDIQDLDEIFRDALIHPGSSETQLRKSVYGRFRDLAHSQTHKLLRVKRKEMDEFHKSDIGLSKEEKDTLNKDLQIILPQLKHKEQTLEEENTDFEEKFGKFDLASSSLATYPRSKSVEIFKTTHIRKSQLVLNTQTEVQTPFQRNRNHEKLEEYYRELNNQQMTEAAKAIHEEFLEPTTGYTKYNNILNLGWKKEKNRISQCGNTRVVKDVLSKYRPTERRKSALNLTDPRHRTLNSQTKLFLLDAGVQH